MKVSMIALAAALCCPSFLHAENVKVGIIAALTGPGAAWGQSAMGGIQLAADEFNEKGGIEINGEKHHIDVIGYDDQYRAAETVAAYRRLKGEDEAQAVFLISSASAVAVRDMIEADEVITLTSAMSNEIFTKDTVFMHRLFSPQSDFLTDNVAGLAAGFPERDVVLLNPNDETGWALAEAAAKAFKAGGFTLVADERFERATKDFQPMLTKLMGMKPNVIDLGSTPPPTAGLIIRQARDLGYKGLFVKTGGPGPYEMAEVAGYENVEGSYHQMFADPTNPAYVALSQRYQKKYGHAPNEVMVAFYDGANVLFNSMIKAGTFEDTRAVTEALPQIFPIKSAQGADLTLTGKEKYGVDKQIVSVNYLGKLVNGKIEVVGSLKAD